ncbi:gamma-aminobutyraldehyde dehydrogenase [Microbacterium faecale]|uniref:Gamma-aminobutyraldehyde dehydrogenase n=1 Tax=Microbacterium faecale TaxID=1804630 RepID=A0A917DCL8_9MICO|nr:aldehyde dehydrogenase family protein [Microbacterium faecale]GGD26841.1 gamma-aminobutyraldehyde dehydrogenase [Microbacterium faecale]
MTHIPSAMVRPQWRDATAYINGISRDEGAYVPVLDPASGQQVGRVQLGDADAADDAVAAAVAAFPAWRDLSPAERGQQLRHAITVAEKEVGELAATVSFEVGKIRHEAFGDVAGSLALLRGFIRLVDEESGREDYTGEDGTSGATLVRIRHVPVGPVSVIGPWNTPLFLTFNGVAPALASGCTVVVKPPVEAPLALTALVRILAAELPPGVLNIVPGRGAVVGQRLAEHPDVRAVIFTGGTATGRSIAAAASSTVKKVALELGGNDPAIVLESATVTPQLISELIAGAFSMTGQICFNIKRLYVHRDRYDEVVVGLRDVLSRVVVGDPNDEATHIGPLTTRDGYENALRLLAAARDAGARVEELGTRGATARWEDGFYVRPTLVTDIAADHELVLDEQFAPILPIIAFDDDDDAVREANRTEFGLASSIWSDDLRHAEAVARRIEAGSTFINAHRLGASVPRTPFGGVKQSGLGRTHGLYSLHHCTQEHAIVGFEDAARTLPGLDRWMQLAQKETTVKGDQK